MTLVSSFLFFIFSSLGLSLLFLSQVYLKSSGYKKNSTVLSYSSENGIKTGFNHLLSLLFQTSFPSPLSSQAYDELRENTRNKGSELLEKLLGSKPPLQISQTWEEMAWESTIDFNLEELLETENYFHATYRVVIRSEGKIKNFNQVKETSLEASLGILAGNIPLSSFPLLVDGKFEPSQGQNFAKKNRITLLPFEKNLLSPEACFSKDKLIPDEANDQLRKALKLRFFRPQNLPSSILRTILGLEKTDEPVPEGVYLVKDSTGLGGIFVQGELEEMVMAIDGNFQVLSFLTKKGRWTLGFSPSLAKTVFTTPAETFYYDLIPVGIIVVNGEIRSLGGGVKDFSGKFTLSREEIPSILNGAKLTIISSDKITISSHLIHQGVRWLEGIPYFKDSNSKLAIFATGKDFLDESKREGKIIVDGSSPQEIKIQASLTASDKGFSIEGKQKTVYLLGSLQTTDLCSNENNLKIKFDERFLDNLEENILELGVPQTANPVLFLSFFKPIEWKDF